MSDSIIIIIIIIMEFLVRLLH